MGSIDEGLQVTKTLVKREPEIVEAPETIKHTPVGTRVDPNELESCYVYDPITFNSINKATQMIMSADYGLQCKDEIIRSYFIEFFNKIGKVGEDITFDELIQGIYQDQMIYGNAYVETVLNKQKNLVVDLVLIDPKTIDYAKDTHGSILLDNYGKPKGYVQMYPYETPTEGKGDPAPKEVDLGTNHIFLIPERIVHFKLYTHGNRFYGLGLIEPAYKAILRKQNIEEAQTNSIYARGTYPILDYIGDENHFPTPAQIQNATDKLKMLQHNRYMALPYWHNVKPLEVKQSDIVENTLNYLREAQCSASGIPMAFATGSGEATNRATLNNQQQLLEYTLKDIVKRTTSIIDKYIFKRICDYKKFKEVPKLVWGTIGTIAAENEGKKEEKKEEDNEPPKEENTRIPGKKEDNNKEDSSVSDKKD